MPFLLPPGSKVYADAAYTNCVIEDMLKDAEGIELLAQRTSRLIRQHEPYIDYIITTMRKRIESGNLHLWVRHFKNNYLNSNLS